MSILIAGRKLLLADDSIAIQKVIDLTFTDEGMEVTTVGDGQDALEKLKQFKPDVVLADIFMPGVDGYELCKFIKQSEQFSGVPVMLLIGTFEPFDEAEAKRAGADDVVTKPFESIRQLVSRVGSLLGSEPAPKEQGHSTLGLDQSEASSTTDVSTPAMEQPESTVSTPEVSDQPEHANVRVFIEAPMMSESQEPVADEHYSPPNIELQTADTRKLEPIGAVPADIATDDTLELEAVPVNDDREIPFEEIAAAEQSMSYEPAQTEANKTFDDSVLDLGDVDNFATATAEDDFVLDLDGEAEAVASVYEAVAAEPSIESLEPSIEPSIPVEPPVLLERISDEPVAELPTETPLADTQEWAIVTPAVEPQNWEVKAEASAAPVQVNASELSAEAIEAISRRVVEHLSDKVVREIAWEVVPELSELLIKKRLDEQK